MNGYTSFRITSTLQYSRPYYIEHRYNLLPSARVCISDTTRAAARIENTTCVIYYVLHCL